MNHLITRRGALAGAAGTVALSSLARGAGTPQRKIGMAVVGLGSYAMDQIMPRIANCEHVRLTGLVSGHPDKARKLADQYGIPARNIYNYDNYERMRDNPEIDAVYVILPNAMHAEYTIRAAKVGKHVLCEKPMATSVAEAEAMIAACRAANVRLMIGYRMHFEPVNIHAAAMVKAGAIGSLRVVGSEHGFVFPNKPLWRIDKVLSGGGALMDMGIYSIQANRYMSGEEPIEVSAIEQTDRSDPRFKTVEDRMSWTFRMPSGALATGLSSYSSAHNHIRATGSTGLLDLEPGTAYHGITLKMAKENLSGASVIEVPPFPKDMFVGQLDHFGECVLTGREPIVSGQEGLRDQKLIAAIYRSAQERRPISLV